MMDNCDKMMKQMRVTWGRRKVGHAAHETISALPTNKGVAGRRLRPLFLL